MDILNTVLNVLEVIIAFIGFYFIVRELKEMREQRMQNRKEIRIKSSIELAREFQVLIDNEITFMHSVLDYKDSSYSKAISQIGDLEMDLFTEQELNELCAKHEELKYCVDFHLRPELHLNEIANAYHSSKKLPLSEINNITMCISSGWELSDEEKAYIKSDKREEKKAMALMAKASIMNYYKNYLISEFGETRVNLLNKFEYLTMSLNTDLADEDIVYVSLHQLFLKTVKLLYPAICNCNNKYTADKYYSHTIETYNRWSLRYEKERKCESNGQKKVTEKSSKFLNG